MKNSVECNVFEADDITVYKYLDPVWDILESVPSDIRITSNELWEKTGLDVKIANQLLKDLVSEFMNKMLNNITSLIFNNKLVVDTWLFDKVMLLSTRVATGGGVNLPDNMVMNMWKQEWLKKRGV